MLKNKIECKEKQIPIKEKEKSEYPVGKKKVKRKKKETQKEYLRDRERKSLKDQNFGGVLCFSRVEKEHSHSLTITH
jgi:hypothetical protein